MHRIRRSRRAVCAGAVASFLAAPIFAADVSWTNPLGGSFAVASNWAGGPAGNADTAIFNLGSAGYTVTFSANVNNQQLRVANDNVSLDLAGRQYNITTGGAGYALQVGALAGQTGRLTVGGGTITAVNSVLGNAAGAIGHGTLSAGARWTNGGSITVGESGSGTMTIHGALTSHIGRIGRQAGATGTLIVEGAAASYSTPGVGLLVGSIGNGSFLIRNGANFSDQGSFISGAGGNGFASISGTGSTWTSVDGVYVGSAGPGTMLINSGGKFIQTGIDFSTGVGVNAGATGRLDAVGGSMDLAAQLSVGNNGNGTLNVSGGGTISSHKAAGDTHGFIGEGTTGIGRVSIGGSQSNWTGDGALGVGYLGAGTLVVGDSGSVNAEEVTIGRFASGNGFALVQGGGTMSAANGVFVGGSGLLEGGTGTLIFRTGGALNAGAMLRAWRNGTIEWQTGGLLDTAAVDLLGFMSMQAGNNKVLGVSTLTIDAAAGGVLDIADNAAVVNYSGASPLAEIRDDIIAGRGGGSWTGPGITSSVATASANFAVGYAEASDIFTAFPAMYLGESIDNTTVLVRGTLAGDTNLDGTVDIGDFAQLAANFNTNQPWVRGDFNYDGVADIGDFALLAANFNQSVPAGLPRAAAVPEPAAALLMGGPLLVIVRRRRLTCPAR